jgi:hypothetical protein
MKRLLARRIGVGGVEPPMADNSRAYFTLDRNSQRWDIYPQPSTGVWTGHSWFYPQGDGPLLFADKEETLWDRIDDFAATHKVTTPPGNPFFPSVPYKPIPSTPIYGPPNKPPDIAASIRSSDLITADRGTQSGTVTFVVVSLLATAGILLARFA